jgi:diguanylate cyclase (GGDEF)-like protein
MVTVAIIAVIAEGVLVARVHGELRARSLALLESLAVTCAADLATGELGRLEDALTELARKGREHLDVISVALLDPRGEAVAHAGEGAAGDEPSPDWDPGFTRQAAAAEVPTWRYVAHHEAAPALAVSMPVVRGPRWGTLVATFDTGAVAERVAEARLIIIGASSAVALTLVLTLQGGLLLLVVRPLRRLREAVRRIEAGDLSARAPAEARSEIGQLASAFNRMATELEAYTRTLEARVAERTAESERREEALEALNAQLVTLARTDGLTGLVNRRHLFELLAGELARAERSGHDVAIAMLDVDHFKQVNDTWGHDAGDAVLQTVAAVLKREVRAHDIVARYGGEEFVVVLVEPEAAHTAEVLERLRVEVARAVTRLPLRPDAAGAREIRVTISAGYVVCPEDAGDLDALLVAADAALYSAKREGRDRVVRGSTVVGHPPGSSPPPQKNTIPVAQSV